MPDLRAGRLLAGSPVLDGRLGDPPLPRPYHVPTESLVFGMLLDELVDQIHGFQRVGRDPL